jgi:integrase
MALYTGQRQADVLAVIWSDISSGTIAVVQEKTQTKVWIAIHRDLRPILDEIPKSAMTVLINQAGKAWTGNGFRATWRKDRANPKHLGFDGLRKSAVVFLLEAGSTDAEVSAVTGQSRGMVEHYARMVNRKKLAAAAVLKWKKNVESTEFVQRGVCSCTTCRGEHG